MAAPTSGADFTYRHFFEGVPDGFVAEGEDWPWTLLQQRQHVLESIEKRECTPEGWHAVGDGPIAISSGVEIWPTAVLVAPVFIGKDSTVLPGAFVSGSWIGDGCLVGHCAEVRDSVVFDRASIGDKSTVLDSIIGAGAQISGGNAYANKPMRSLLERVDGLPPTNVVVRFGESVLDTGLEKFGFIGGDSIITPMRLSTDPGTMVGRSTVVYPQGGIPLRGIWIDVPRIRGFDRASAYAPDRPT